MRRVVIALAVLGAPAALVSQSADEWPPGTLRETGLYADWNAKRIGPEKWRFSPQYPLWTDGAVKARWMELPPATFIDASNPDVWDFPVGTRFWKEFTFSRRAETRFIEYTPKGWQYAAYAWNDDESEALLVSERGMRQSVAIRDGVRHSIPSRSDCKSCHEGSPSRILGFSALQLSADRDPNAPHAEPLPERGVTLQTLIARGVIRGLPAHLAGGAPRVAAASPTARAAIGYLHGNCAACHTLSGELASLELSLQYSVAAPAAIDPPALATVLGLPSKFVPASWDPSAVATRVVPGRPDRSVLAFRMASRNPIAQMPPLGTHFVDDEGVALIRRWILEDLGSASQHMRAEAGP
jgi:mono/diheme cytochrome c family protein